MLLLLNAFSSVPDSAALGHPGGRKVLALLQEAWRIGVTPGAEPRVRNGL